MSRCIIVTSVTLVTEQRHFLIVSFNTVFDPLIHCDGTVMSQTHSDCFSATSIFTLPEIQLEKETTRVTVTPDPGNVVTLNLGDAATPDPGRVSVLV